MEGHGRVFSGSGQKQVLGTYESGNKLSVSTKCRRSLDYLITTIFSKMNFAPQT
jgi:hypothetical protein